MKKRCWWAIFLPVLLAFAGLSVFVLYPRPYCIDRVHFDALSVGMTRKEVDRVLGGSARVEFFERVIVWVPVGTTRKSAELRRGRPIPSFFPTATTIDGDEELVWVSDTGLIAARFNNQGIMQEKYFSTVAGPKLSPIDRLLRSISREATFTSAPAPGHAIASP